MRVPVQAVETLQQLAMQAIDRNELATAYQYAGDILQQERGEAIAHAILANFFEKRHDLAVAKAHAETSLGADPDNAMARIALTHAMLRQNDLDGAEATITPLTQFRPATAHVRAVAWGVLGDVLDRRGDASRAFQAFAQCNRLMMTLYGARGYDYSSVHPSAILAMARFAKEAAPSRWRPQRPREMSAPAFLVGFPRSGTTLLDQILSSNSEILCLEEKDYLTEAVSEVLEEGAGLERVGALSETEANVVRRSYWRQVGETAASVIIDKMPLHVTLLPIIKIIFPEAKIIVAVRDPRDVILSCFQQRFQPTAAMIQLLTLEGAATLYDAVMQLYVICRDQLGIALHEVRYEEVVSDVEAQARALCKFLEVPFEPAMLDHRAKARGRHILTPSARQVVEPLYTRSIGRWRSYSKELAPVLPVLDRWIKELGYQN